MKKILAATLCLALCIGLVACGSKPATTAAPTTPAPTTTTPAPAAPAEPAKIYIIKLSYSPGGLKPEESAEIMYADLFKKTVEEKSSGAIKVEIYPSNQLGSAADVVGSIAAGTVQMGIYDISMMTSYFQDAMVLATPGLFKSVDECDKVLKSDWAKAFFDKAKAASGIKIIGAHSKGFRCFTTSNKELKTVGDAKGVTFRVMDSPVYIKMVETLGGHAVPMAGSEMYVAMQNHVVDGQENAVNNIIQDKTYEVQKYLVLDEHAAGITAIMMSGSFYDSLSADLQKVVNEANDAAIVEAAKVIYNRNTNGVQILKDKGMSVYQPTDQEKADWQNAVLGPCEEYIRSKIGNETVDGLKAVLDGLRK